MKVILLMAITLDGRIGVDASHFPDWTGKADKSLFIDITRKAGVVIMGSTTFDTIGRPLPKRLNVVLTRDRNRRSHCENLIFTHEDPLVILRDLSQHGYTEAILAGGATINSLFARAGVVDEVMVTVSPFIFGRGLSLFTPEIAMDLKLIETHPLDEQRVCLHYKVVQTSLNSPD